MATKKKNVVAEGQEKEEKVVQEAADSSDAAAGVSDGLAKSNMMSIAMKKMAGMTYPDMVKFFNDSIAQIGKEAETIPDGSAEKNQASIAMKGAIKEDLDLLFGGDETLTEEFKEKVTTIFESAVNARVAIVEAELEEQYAAKLEERVNEITEDLVDKMDEYTSYIAEDWMEKNKVAIEPALTTEITKDFIAGLRNLFVEHNIFIPDEQVDAVEALTEKVAELEKKLNEEVEAKVKLKGQIEEFEKQNTVASMTEGMTVTQAEKFKTLAESVDYDGDMEAFKKKLEIIKEHHFKTKSATKDTQILTEEIAHSPDEVDETEKKVIPPEMSGYVAAIARTVKR